MRNKTPRNKTPSQNGGKLTMTELHKINNKISWCCVQLRHALHAEDWDDFDRLSKQKDELNKRREELLNEQREDCSEKITNG